MWVIKKCWEYTIKNFNNLKYYDQNQKVKHIKKKKRTHRIKNVSYKKANDAIK